MPGGLVRAPTALLESARQYSVSKAAADLDSSGDDPQPTTKDTSVCFWYLTASSGSVETTPSNIQGLSRMRDPPGAEAVVNIRDGRTLVADEHFNDRAGKYRAIVKLFMLFENQEESTDDEAAWPIATGWLVAPDIVVTAGHCAYDHSHNLGRLVKVRAYVGYKGQGDLSNTEGRWGTAVATTQGWLTEVGLQPSDISFIKLATPFTTVDKVFSWKPTPFSQCGADLGVVGYPGDIMEDGERGARMYEMFTSTTYNLETSDQHMLQYKIDTYGGNSGSPVFNNRQSLQSIGVHVLGGYSYNSASVFDGFYGNRFMALQLTAAALTTDQARPQQATQPDQEGRPWLWQLVQQTTESDVEMQALSKSLVEAEKVVAPIPAKLLYAIPSELSFGPDAGPEVSILASAAIATAGRLAADSVDATHAESLSKTRPYDGIISRAVLGEAALQFYSTKTLKDSQKKKVQEYMAPVVAGLGPYALGVTPKLIKSIMEPSSRLLLSRVAGKTTPDPVRSDNENLQAELDVGFGRELQRDELEFFNKLMEYAAADEACTESFYSALTSVGNFIGSAFKKAGPVLTDVAKIGLPLLLGGTEAGTSTVPEKTSLDPLAHRAIVAEACLQSFVQLHSDLQLDKKFFTHLVDKVKDLGPKMVNVAPYAVQFVGPVVADILRENEEKRKAAEKKQEFLDFTWVR